MCRERRRAFAAPEINLESGSVWSSIESDQRGARMKLKYLLDWQMFYQDIVHLDDFITNSEVVAVGSRTARLLV